MQCLSTNRKYRSLIWKILMLCSLTWHGCQPECDMPCENGGSCLKGTCDCPENTEGDFCQIKIPRTIAITRINFAPSNFSFCLEGGDPPTNTQVEGLILDGNAANDPIIAQTNLTTITSLLFISEQLYFSSDQVLNDLEKEYRLEVWRDCPEGDPRDNALVLNASFRPMDWYNKDNLAFVELGFGGIGITGQWVFD